MIDNRIELLPGESSIEFPAIMDIKVFAKGRRIDELEIERIVLTVVESQDFFGVSTRQSRKGNFQSFSCKVHLQDRPQFDELFETLSAHPDVKMVM